MRLVETVLLIADVLRRPALVAQLLQVLVARLVVGTAQGVADDGALCFTTSVDKVLQCSLEVGERRRCDAEVRRQGRGKDVFQVCVRVVQGRHGALSGPCRTVNPPRQEHINRDLRYVMSLQANTLIYLAMFVFLHEIGLVREMSRFSLSAKFKLNVDLLTGCDTGSVVAALCVV
jgi:hypothetical protein